MVKASSVGTEYVVNDRVFTTKTTLKLKEGLKAELAHKSGSNAVALKLSGKDWEVQHDFARKDFNLKCKTKLGRSTLTIKQHVPKSNWALVPTPEFELSRSGLLGKHDKLVGAYDFMNRTGRLEETVYAGADKEHKAWIKLSTAAGPSAGLRSKLRAGPLLHSAAAAFSQREGWSVSAKSKFEDVKVKTTYVPNRQTVSVAAKHAAKPLGGDGAKASLTLHIDYPLQSKADPRIKFGIKWDL